MRRREARAGPINADEPQPCLFGNLAHGLGDLAPGARSPVQPEDRATLTGPERREAQVPAVPDPDRAFDTGRSDRPGPRFGSAIHRLGSFTETSACPDVTTTFLDIASPIAATHVLGRMYT
jgi:hypothetical protein